MITQVLRFARTFLPFFVLSLTLLAPEAQSQQRLRGMSLSPNVTPADIAALATYKANVVRYQLTWLGPVDTANEAEYNVWLDSALAHFDTLLPVFQAHNIKVILDIHTPPGGLSKRSEPHEYRLFSEAWAQDAFVTVWDKITQRYLGNTVIFGYDLLNEPAQRTVAPGLKNWSALALHVSQRIRAVDTLHKIIIEPLYGDQAKLGALKPIKLPGIIYSVHTYYPFKFVHQGLYGIPIKFKYPTKSFDKAALRRNLQRLMVFQRKNKAKIYIGEFTAARWAPGASSTKYLKDLMNIFEANRWDWTYHAWREADVWSVEHGSDRNNPNEVSGTTDRAALLKKFFAKNK